jgi:hypothetical protein
VYNEDKLRTTAPHRRVKDMKKTEYTMVIVNMSGANTNRRVYEENGKYFIKINGEVRDVTQLKKDFYRD